MKQYEVLRRASLFLQQNNCETKVADILLRHFLQLSQVQFLANMQQGIKKEVLEKFWQALQEHVTTKKPLQHILGYEYFYGRRFYVNEHVLIPRPETEELVETILCELQQQNIKDPLTIVDIGTGSGVIAITLALELKGKDIKLLATDISQQALEVAKENAAKHQVDIQFLSGDFAQPLIDRQIKVNILMSNPPYIAQEEISLLSPTVQHDPDIALFAANDGLAAYETILKQSKKIITNKALLAFEIGYRQGQAVKQLIQRAYPRSSVNIKQDINGHDRIVMAYIG